MSKAERVRRQQLLRQAEGYLELILAGQSKIALDPEHRDRLALRCLECLEESEDNVEEKGHLYYLRGEALRLLERYTEAIDALRAAAEFDDESVYTYLSLGWCYKRVGDVYKAIEALEAGLEVDYTLAILHYNLACYWSLVSRPKEAVSHLSTAFEIDGAFRDLVNDECDFDPIRKHPEFQALTSVIV